MATAQQVNDIDPGGSFVPFGGGSSRGLGDVVAGPFDVETGPYDNRCLGVEEAWDHYWVTGRGQSTVGDNYMIHKYDKSGAYLTSYPQTVPAPGGWGGRDMEADDAANTLWVGNDGGLVEVQTYDAVTGGLTYSSTVTTAVVGTVRALCQNTATGNFFTKSFTSSTYEFDMATGAVVNVFVNSAISSYGMGYDSNKGTIWSTDAGGSASEMDPATGLGTGTGFFGSVTGSQGGADVYNDPLNANGLSMVMLCQATPDSICVYDTVGAPPPPPPTWPEMPTTFVSAAGYTENFDGHAGVVPSFMGANALSDITGLPDPGAWCNIGQQGACGQETGSGAGVWAGSGSGAYCLEMGGDPLGPTGFANRSGLVIGLDGSGAGDLTLEFGIVDHGEETHSWDGVWVSADGATYTQVYGPWSPLLPSWQVVSGIDLSNSGVDTDGQFYLLFAQSDNFPMGYLDGIQIDDISISGPAPPAPTLDVTGLVAGGTATMSASNCTPNGKVFIVFSLAGGGPVSTPFGDGFVSPPYNVLKVNADGSGAASLDKDVPAGAAGVSVWFHGADHGSATLLNALALTVG
tara:strand:- start:206 stop:1927 length:1722 start_codon:yes stop_codon:yes gene_type:complete